MIKKELLKQLIRDFHLRKSFDVISRDIQPPVDSKKIITLIGVRRCGKTSILYEMINRLSQTIDKTKIVFLNFEDERISFSTEELDLILQSYSELYPKHDLSECYFFFDEIQNVAGWETFVRRVYDTVSKRIFITGSNSKMLSTDIATSLRGRTLSFEVFPLSFGEYLRFKQIEVDLYSSRQLAHIRHAMDEYLRDGAFPEIVTIDKAYTVQVLQEYFDVLLYKDLAERYNISNLVALKFFLKRVIASSTKQISINKIYNELRSSGIKIGKNTLYEYLDHVQSIYLSLVLNRYDPSLVKKELGEKKIYSIDIGLNNATEFKFSDDRGKALENSVFLQLRRTRRGLYYYKDEKSECDFVTLDRGKVDKVIQVTYDMSDEATRKREFNGLINAAKSFGLKEGTIITYDDEESMDLEGVRIELIPFFKFAIDS